MHINDYLATSSYPQTTPWESDWLAITTISLRSGMLAISDPSLFPDDTVVELPPAEYHIQAKIVEYSDDRRISRLRVTSDEEAQRRQVLSTVGVDFAQVGVGDFEAIGSAAERLDEAGEAAFIASLEAPSLWGIALWGRQPEAQMPFVSSGFGDGRYPIYELVSSRGRVGIEVVFIDLSEAEVHIGHPKTEFLHIRVTGRSHPASVDYWDGNWFNTEVTILAGGFRGRVEGYLRAEELATFNDELTALYNSLSGTVSFETIEQWLSIKMSTDGRGHIAAECVVRDKPGMGNTLTFSLDLDQSFLPALLQQLEEITTLFPVLGSPPTPDP